MEHTDLLFNHGIDYTNDRIILTGPVDAELYRRLLNGLTILNSKQLAKPRKGKSKAAPANITVLLSTTGGGVDAAFAMYDLIRGNTARPVRVVASGPCYSAGTLLLAAATGGRASLPHSSFMYHFGASSQSSRGEMEHNMERHDEWVEIIQDQSRVAGEVFDWHNNGGDKYLTPQVLLTFGLIDEIVTEFSMGAYIQALGTFLVQLIICLIFSLISGYPLTNVVSFWALLCICICHVNITLLVERVTSEDRHRD